MSRRAAGVSVKLPVESIDMPLILKVYWAGLALTLIYRTLSCTVSQLLEALACVVFSFRAPAHYVFTDMILSLPLDILITIYIYTCYSFSRYDDSRQMTKEQA